MEIPKNCSECEYYKTCTNAYYSGTTCKHHDDIMKAILDKGKKDGRN